MSKTIETITREQAIGMLIDALLLGEFKPRVNGVSSEGRFVVFMNVDGPADMPIRSDALWGRCTDPKLYDELIHRRVGNALTEDKIKRLINASDSFGRFKREEQE